MNEFDISIIIPCYNGWKYMKKCIESLENQQVAPKQVIVVDDCSSDDSFERLVEYSKNTKLRMSVYKNDKNCGPGKTRHNALKYVKTKYVAFCDCDDWYERDFISSISECEQSKGETDLIIIGSYTCSENGEKSVNSETKKMCEKSKKEIIAMCQMSLCRLVVKSDLIKTVSFPPLYHAEDGVVVSQVIAMSNNIEILDKPLYNYLTRIGSASTTPSPNTFRDFVIAYNLIVESLGRQYAEEVEFIGIKYICYGAILNALKYGVNKEQIVDVLNCFEKTNPNWYANQYRKSLSLTKRIYVYAVKHRFWNVTDMLTRIHTELTRK